MADLNTNLTAATKALAATIFRARHSVPLPSDDPHLWGSPAARKARDLVARRTRTALVDAMAAAARADLADPLTAYYVTTALETLIEFDTAVSEANRRSSW